MEVVHCQGCDDAQAAAMAVRERRPVVLQQDQLEPVDAQRVVDVVSGAINALDGQSERLREMNVLSPTADELLSRKLRIPA